MSATTIAAPTHSHTKSRSSGSTNGSSSSNSTARLWEPLDSTLTLHSTTIASIRTRLQQQCDKQGIPFSTAIDDLFIYRFLRGWNLDEDKALSALSDANESRHEHNLDAVREKAKDLQQMEFPHAPLIFKYYPHRVTHCFDRTGQPVSIERIGFCNPSALIHHVPFEQFLEYHLYHMENKAHMVRQLSKDRNVVMRVCKILDLQNLGRQHLTRKGMAYLKSIIALSQKNYPEMLASLYVINVPWAFTLVWKVVKPWLNENTLNKISILGNDYSKTLEERIGYKNLPDYLGGECTCSENNPAYINIPGMMLEDPKSGKCLPLFNPEDGKTVTEVAARDKFQTQIKIEKKNMSEYGAVVSWEFRTRKNNIAFGYSFSPAALSPAAASASASLSAPVSSTSSTRPLSTSSISFLSPVKVESEETQSGHVEIREEGVLTLTFDNSYSYFTGKTLVWKVDIDMAEKKEKEDEEVSEMLKAETPTNEAVTPTSK